MTLELPTLRYWTLRGLAEARKYLLNWFEMPKDVGTFDIATSIWKNWLSNSNGAIRKKETKKTWDN